MLVHPGVVTPLPSRYTGAPISLSVTMLSCKKKQRLQGEETWRPFDSKEFYRIFTRKKKKEFYRIGSYRKFTKRSSILYLTGNLASTLISFYSSFFFPVVSNTLWFRFIWFANPIGFK